MMKEDLWPGGRTRLSNGGRYIPRYLTKIPSQQDTLLGADTSWQPSKSDRQIRGSVPNIVLLEHTVAADNKAVNPTDPDVAARSSVSSESTRSDWPPTPPTSLGPSRSALPDTSSPLQEPHPMAKPCSLSIGFVEIAKQALEYRSRQSTTGSEAADGTGVAIPVGRESTSGIVPTQSSSAASTPTASGHDTMQLHSQLSPGSGLTSSAQQRPRTRDGDAVEIVSGQENVDRISGQSNLVAAEFYTQLEPKHHELIGKSELVQVQRTPFACGEPARLRREVSPLPSSSPSIVMGTLLKAQNQLDLPGTRSSKSDSDLSQERLGELAVYAMLSAEPKAEGQRQQRQRGCQEAATVAGAGATEDETSTRHPRSLASLLGKRRRESNSSSNQRSPSGVAEEGNDIHSNVDKLKRRRAAASSPPLRSPTGLGPTESSENIARESRRAFFRTHLRTMNVSPSLVLAARQPDPPQREQYGQQRGSIMNTDHQTSGSPQSRQATGLRVSVDSSPESGSEIRGEGSPRLSASTRNKFDEYQQCYPDYKGDAAQFHKACKQILALQRQGRAPHPSIWDDFIFCRHNEYRAYLVRVSESCEDALPYLQYYWEHVLKPTHMQFVVTKDYVAALDSDSALGSSISAGHGPLAEFSEVDKSERSLSAVGAVGSRLMKSRLPEQAFQSLRDSPAKEDEQAQDIEHERLERAKIKQTQDSSVQQWVELHSVDRLSGAASPELGSTSLAAKEEEEGLALPDTRIYIRGSRTPGPTSSSPAPSPLVSSPRPGRWPQSRSRAQSRPLTRPQDMAGRAKSREQARRRLWSDDANTPFKFFARSFTALKCERRLLQGPVHSEKGGVQSHMRGLVERLGKCD